MERLDVSCLFGWSALRKWLPRSAIIDLPDEVVGPDDTTWRWPAWLGLIAVVALFGAPLFIGLERWDQRNDEAIYSYAVDRILETGDWLTPRSIPYDGPFFEKPPLKFWLVAAGMRLGLLPHDDGGMRMLDALFCAIAFVYVYLMARRMGGVAAGVTAAFVLFSYDPLIFEHGVRGNNMEGTLMLAYCGGVYHFLCWTAAERPAVRRIHAHAWMLLFVAAFLSKFAAAAFLPVVCLGILATRPSPWAAWRGRWRDWVLPAVVAVLLSAPWFVYQTVRDGRQFWYELVGLHVYARFFGTLVVEHLAPWHHYFTETWHAFGLAQMQPAIVAGVVALLWRARQGDWLARSMLVWWLVPFALMSVGTSKLFYYAYPFLPPLAIGTGVAASQVMNTLRSAGVRRWLERRGAAVHDPETYTGVPPARLTLASLGLAALVLAVVTAIHGPVTFEWDGTRLFRNSSAARAVVIAGVLWFAAGWRATALSALGVGLVATFLPIGTYAPRVERFSSDDHPLRTIRDCSLAVQRSGGATGVFAASGDMHHAYFYYLRHLGPWTDFSGGAGEFVRRLEAPGAQTPTLLSMDDYVAIGGTRPAMLPAREGSPTPLAADAPLEGLLPRGISIGEVVILLPGPYDACTDLAARAGGHPLPRAAAAAHTGTR